MRKIKVSSCLWALASGIACLMLTGLMLAGCNGKPNTSALEKAETVVETPIDPVDPKEREGVRVSFAELAKSAGIHFKHEDCPTPMHYVAEIMGSGVAWIDYDQDGYMDLVLVQGGKFPPEPNQKPGPIRTRLFRNMGDGTFMDVTEKSGIWHPDFGQGIAVGDYDNDGFPDLFISCYGHCHLYHNEPAPGGGRTFREVTKEAGINATNWCSSCAFGDFHGNGFLDIYVCRYVLVDLKNYPNCGDIAKTPPIRYACGPKEFHSQRSLLYRNNGNGTFTEIGEAAGLDDQGKGLCVITQDFHGRGPTDILMGSDEVPGTLYRNTRLDPDRVEKKKKLFESMGVMCGATVNSQGKPMGSMGLEAGDLHGKGRTDVLIAAFYHEGVRAFKGEGKGQFTDISDRTGMLGPTNDMVAWGLCLLDVDCDGFLDVAVVNGHVYRNSHEMESKAADGNHHVYLQRPLLFMGEGNCKFREFKKPGPYFAAGHVGRGLAMCDYDNDGLMDLVVNGCGEEAALLHNETVTPYHWIRLIPEGNRHANPNGSNRDAIGAMVTLTVGGKKVVHHVKGGCSYLSSNDRRLLIGLGKNEKVDEIEVRWPNREVTVQKFGPLQADRSYKLVEDGKAVDANCPPIKKK